MDLCSPLPPSTQDPRSALSKILEDESAVRLLRKATAKPLLTGLRFIDQEIPHGLRAGDVLEVFGSSGTGKSELLLGMIVFMILPQRYRDLDIGGSEIGVVYFDNDLKFNMQRLVLLLTIRWERAISQALLDSRFTALAVHMKEDPTAKELFLRSTLERLIVYRCTDALQFAATLATLAPLLKSKDNIRLLMIDTISAFYYQTKLADKKQDREPLIISQLLSQHNLVVVVTKGRLGALKGNNQEEDKDYMPPIWGKLVKYRITLTKDFSSPLITARFSKNTSSLPSKQPPAPPKTASFRIENDGISLQ